MKLDPDSRGVIRRALENRVPNFLELAGKVLGVPQHPYAQLFAVAGCTYADLESGIKKNGLDSTLDMLLREGVYLTLDEFRCKTKIVRGGRHIPASMKDWDNARGSGPLKAFSSGTSGGKRVETSHSLENARFGLAGSRVMLDEFNRSTGAAIALGSILPSAMGLGTCISSSRLGHPIERWFALGGSNRENWHYKALTRAIVTRLRLGGAKIPYPTYLEGDDFSPVAEFIARRKKEGAEVGMSGMVSSVARVAGAAIDRGLDIRGSWALVTGESLTDVKRKLIEASGIDVFPVYATSDFGGIGVPCRQMTSGDCVHIAEASIALTSRPVDFWGDGETVQSLHVTAVVPFAPRVLINVEIGDTGVMEPSHCDCEFSRLGYTRQVRNIAAFSKISAQGSTLYAPELVRLLEESLPQKFGGRPGDFQLLEVEGKAQTETVLRIHPRLNVGPE
ncbi:MAG: hypothetical protein LAO79_27675, partial [Acidobacteriia bacterium]|nr:hypothetical protein [Terriglobia bacterium]